MQGGPQSCFRLQGAPDFLIVRRYGPEKRPPVLPVNAPALSAPSPAPPVRALPDFADRWPAMVVKELRQGLRAQGFVGPFLVLHLLALGAVALEFLLTRTATAGSGWSAAVADGSGLFWPVVYLMVALVMPLRLMDSLHAESDGRNAELLLLGGLTRWQIVRGKWTVQALLAGLALLSLLPYMLVRYFFGGVELVQNFFTLLSVFASSLGIAGCVIGASGYAGLGMRFFIIGTGVLILGLTVSITEGMINHARGAARTFDYLLFIYGYAYAMLLHVLYATIGMQLGRAHLKLFLMPYEISPTRGMVTMLLTAPFMLVAGGIATCGYGAIIVLLLLVYSVVVFDRTPATADWALRRPGP